MTSSGEAPLSERRNGSTRSLWHSGALMTMTGKQMKDKARTLKIPKQETAVRPSPSEQSVLSIMRNVFVVAGVALIALAAFRNSLTWHLQKFWGASGNFWQEQWDTILETFGEEPYFYSVYGGVFYALVIYWLLGSTFILFDVTLKPAALRKYKVQPAANAPLDVNKLPHVVAVVLFNQTVVTLLFAHVWFTVAERRGLAPLRPLPHFHRLLVDVAVFVMVEEVLFYYAHRLLHHRVLYRLVHKKHHEWTAPVAVTAVYCHPLEHALGNTLPVLAGPLLMGSHVTTVFVWLTLAMLNTIVTHSGYHLPFLMSPEDHDFHHQKFNCCYGVLGILDRLHGTDAAFRKSPAFRRHTLLLSLQGARERFPDQ